MIKEKSNLYTRIENQKHVSAWDKGSALIYNGDIAERLCTPSEFKAKKQGDLPPNSSEEWLDCQARALSQASRRVIREAKK